MKITATFCYIWVSIISLNVGLKEEDFLKQNFNEMEIYEILKELHIQNINTEKNLEKLIIENEVLKEKVEILNDDFSRLVSDVAPIGTIVAWTPKPDQDTLNPVDLPDGWVLCDGSVITYGIWAGQSTPDLNGRNRFLRGGSYEDVLIEENQGTRYQDMFFLPSHTDGSGHHTFSCEEFGAEKLFELEIASNDQNKFDDMICKRSYTAETKPINTHVIWIMKIDSLN